MHENEVYNIFWILLGIGALVAIILFSIRICAGPPAALSADDCEDLCDGAVASYDSQSCICQDVWMGEEYI